MAVSIIPNPVKELQVETGTFSSSDWTANKATFTSGTYYKYGKIWVAELSLKTNAAYNAGSEYELGTLKPSAFPCNTKSFGIHVFGTVTAQGSGLLRTAPSTALSSGRAIYMKILTVDNS